MGAVNILEQWQPIDMGDLERLARFRHQRKIGHKRLEYQDRSVSPQGKLKLFLMEKFSNSLGFI